MKKNILKVMIIFSLFCSLNVKAESFYTTDSGVELTKFQYDAITDIYSEEYAQNLTQEDYDFIHAERMIEGEFKYDVFDPSSSIVPYSPFHETEGKKLSISSSCNSSYCKITTTVTWKLVPVVRSYDVIGIRLLNTTLYDNTNSVSANFDGVNKSNVSAGKKQTTEGIANAVVVPTTGNISFVSQENRVKNVSGASIHGSYQHAVKLITLTKALDFTFDGAGYGGVFSWPSKYGQMFDKMAGVSIRL